MSANPTGKLGIVEKTMFLQTVTLFSKVDLEDIARISTIAREIHWKQGHVIFNEGEPADAMYIVSKGSVSIRKGDKEHSRADEGACFGDLAILLQGRRFFTAVAMVDTDAISLTATDFMGLLTEHEGIALSIIRFLAEWVARYAEDIRR